MTFFFFCTLSAVKSNTAFQLCEHRDATMERLGAIIRHFLA